MPRYIDADALKQRIMNNWYTASEISDDIDAEPTADVQEVKHGKWILKPVKRFCSPDCWYPPFSSDYDTWDEEEGSWLEEEPFCSECDYKTDSFHKSNYCPNCGADMRGGTDG